MNHIAKKKVTEANLRKAFRIKLFELCKTKIKKSSPDLFNFYVISDGHGMTNDDDRASTCRRNFKAPWLQTERTKNEGPSEKLSFNGETVWRFQTKKFKNSTPPMENKSKEPQDPKGKNWRWTHANRRKTTEAKLKKSIRIKLLELCKTRNKKSSPDLFNILYTRLVMTWPMTLAGLPRAGAVSKPHGYKQNVQIMKGLLKKLVLTRKQFENFRKKKSKTPFLPWTTNQKNHKTPTAKTEDEPMQARGKKLKQNWKNHSE